MFGMDNMISELMSNKLEETLAVIREVMKQFQDPVCSSSSQITIQMTHVLDF